MRSPNFVRSFNFKPTNVAVFVPESAPSLPPGLRVVLMALALRRVQVKDEPTADQSTGDRDLVEMEFFDEHASARGLR